LAPSAPGLGLSTSPSSRLPQIAPLWAGDRGLGCPGWRGGGWQGDARLRRSGRGRNPARTQPLPRLPAPRGGPMSGKLRGLWGGVKKGRCCPPVAVQPSAPAPPGPSQETENLGARGGEGAGDVHPLLLESLQSKDRLTPSLTSKALQDLQTQATTRLTNPFPCLEFLSPIPTYSLKRTPGYTSGFPAGNSAPTPIVLLYR
jgi:hypothetical protein